jgi:hypothetical protein
LELFKQRANKDGIVAVSLVTRQFKQLALNWLCHAKKINISNYVFLALDKEIFDHFKAINGTINFGSY